MEAINKWAYALGDEESYNGIFFDSKEDALDEAMYVARKLDIPTVWVGQVEMYQPTISILKDNHKIKAGVMTAGGKAYAGIGYQAGRFEGMAYTHDGRNIDAAAVTYTIKQW